MNKMAGDKYIKMMWGQITISVSILLAMIGLIVAQQSYISENSGEHLELFLNQEITRLKNAELLEHEIRPTILQCQDNSTEIAQIKKHLHVNDSLNKMQTNSLVRLFRAVRILRDGPRALND